MGFWVLRVSTASYVGSRVRATFSDIESVEFMWS